MYFEGSMMRNWLPRFVALVVIVGALRGVTVLAADPSPAAEPPPYHALTSDIMTAFIQPRHTKLYLGARARNWEYAEYERRNIGGALERWEKAVPQYKDQPVAAWIAAFAKPQLAAVEAAIKAHDPAAFDAAYDGLTTGCNQCHQASGHAFIVIKRPNAGAFSEQDFAHAAP